MMKLVVVAAVLAALIVADSVTGLPPGPSRLALQASLISKRQVNHFSAAKEYRLYNRPAYRSQIGTSVLVCTETAHNWRNCTDYIRLGSGNIIASALVATAAGGFMTLAVLGGTGQYSNAGGTLTLQPIDSNTQVVIGTLEGF